MVGDLLRSPSATPEGQNPEGQNPGHAANPGNVPGVSNIPEPKVPRRTGKEPMLPEDPANQDYTEGGDDEEDYNEGYYPMIAEEEVALLRQQLAESDRVALELTHHLDESKRNQAGKSKKKKSTRMTQTEVIDTATVQTDAQTRTGPMTRQAARASGDM